MTFAQRMYDLPFTAILIFVSSGNGFRKGLAGCKQECDRTSQLPLNNSKMAGQTYDHRIKNKKYTTPLPYSWDVGQQKDILRWLSQQKNFSLCTKDYNKPCMTILKSLHSFFPFVFFYLSTIYSSKLPYLCSFYLSLFLSLYPNSAIYCHIFGLNKRVM